MRIEHQNVSERVRHHMPVLDGIRGVAILLVLAHNGGAVQIRASSLLLKMVYFMHAPGWIGVQLFFVLSGFLITGILLDSKGRSSLGQFWIRRALRIFPLYFSFLLLVTLAQPLLSKFSAFRGHGNMWWYWTYLCNWSQPHGHMISAFAHFWSLAVEEQFYLVWPLVCLVFGRRALFNLSIGLAVLALLLRFWSRSNGAFEEAYQYTLTRMDALALGAAAAIVARNPAWLTRVVPYLSKVMVVSSALIVISWPFTHGFNIYDTVVQIVGYAVLSVLFAAGVLRAVVNPGVELSRALSLPWLRWLGKYSYAIYVFHLPIAAMLTHWLGPIVNGSAPGPALLALILHESIVATLSIGAALISWNLLERRVLALKDRLNPRNLRGPIVLREPSATGRVGQESSKLVSG